MKYFQLAIFLFSLALLGSCTKTAEPIIYTSQSGKVQIEVTGTQVPLDPWKVSVKVIVNNKPFYELSQIEVYISDLNNETVSFDWIDGACTVNFLQTDGTQFPVPIVKLPEE